MTKFAALVAVAALCAAGSANAAGITVSLVGKSPAQAHADITKAAKRICRAQTTSASFRHLALSSCVKETVATTLTQVEPAAAQLISMAD